MLRLLLVISVSSLLGCQATSTEMLLDPAVGAEVAAEGDQSVIPLNEVKPSQSGSVSQTVADTQITVTYDRPVARGRELFGGIVPYGKVWNPGANDATVITVSRAVTINGNRLAAGKYSIWAIPGESEWTVILSRAAEVFHEPYPGEEHDALRVTVVPTVGDYIETLAFYFPVVEKKDTELRLHWGDTIVPFAITVP